MNTLIQKILVEEQHSFACRKYRTPQFETTWHKHEECELIVITEGHGTALIGDYVGEYKKGDVFFLSSNLPHWFRKTEQKMIGHPKTLKRRRTAILNGLLSNLSAHSDIAWAKIQGTKSGVRSEFGKSW